MTILLTICQKLSSPWPSQAWGQNSIRLCFGKIRPLYFGFLSYYNRRSNQPIYLNFENLNLCIKTRPRKMLNLSLKTRPELDKLVRTVPYLKYYRGDNYEILRITRRN